MKKFNKKQRNKIYRLALELMEHNNFLCDAICEAITKIYGPDTGYNSTLGDNVIYFKELLPYEVKDRFGWWEDWDNKTPRIKCLNECIEKTN